jgi:hypothetical protein
MTERDDEQNFSYHNLIIQKTLENSAKFSGFKFNDDELEIQNFSDRNTDFDTLFELEIGQPQE